MRDHGICYRDYQIAGRDAAFSEFSGGLESGLIVMPTGSGKTVLAGMCAERAIDEHDWNVLFVAHREVLITQAYKTFTRFGFETAIEMGVKDARNHIANLGHPEVVVASIQSLQDDRLMRWSPNSFGLIIIDECHRSLSPMYTKMLNWFEGYRLLGITATPRRGDSRNLGARFQKKVYEYRLRKAIQEGWLVRIIGRDCPTSIDLRGLKMIGGDFSVGELEERIGPQIEMLARAFLKEVGSRPFVFFTPGVGSAMAFAQVCSEIGTPTRYVAGQGGQFGMGKPERNANLEAFDAGEYQGVACCELLMEGWDCPRVEAVGNGRPTRQQYRYQQEVGRGTRPSPETGKENCLVVNFDWEMDPDVKDLCSTVELFDDESIDEEVFAVAREIARERAVDVDPIDVIEEAERIVKTRTKFLVKLTGKEAQYAALTYDPVGVSKLLDIDLNRKYDLDKQGRNPASAAQVWKLKSLGVVDIPEALSKWGASKMISKIDKRIVRGLATVEQVKVLLSSGVDADLARSLSASSALAAIKELDATKPKTQTRLFS